MKSKVVVVGRGFVGGHVVEEVVRSGGDVVICGDVCREVKVSGPVDYIVHTAGKTSPRSYLSDPVGVLEASIEGTRNLLALAREKGSELLFVSSGEVYGEFDPAGLRWCYAEGKRAGEAMCVAWAKQYGVKAKIVRLFHTYGPGMKLGDGRVFSDFVSDIVSRRNLQIRSDGSPIRTFCYVTDAVEGLLAVLTSGEVAVPYDLGNDEAEISIRGLAQMMAEEFGVGVEYSKKDEGCLNSPVSRSCPDTSLLRGLGWRPKVGIKEGFRRTVESFGGGL